MVEMYRTPFSSQPIVSHPKTKCPPCSHHCKTADPVLPLPQVMWVCNLCRKQQEILTKSGAWFYGPGPGQAFEGGPQGKKARLQDPSLYPYHQGAPGDTSTLPASQRGRPRGGLLPRQSSLDNGTTSRYSGSGDLLIDR